jgi:error-prone DNA polymerase
VARRRLRRPDPGDRWSAARRGAAAGPADRAAGDQPAGYANLCRLISRGRLACPKGHSRVRLPELATAGDDLIALWCEPDMLPALREPFAGRLYALVARHRQASELAAEARLRATAGRLGVPAVAGSRCCTTTRRGGRLQDVVTCIRLGRTLGAAGTAIRGNAEHELSVAGGDAGAVRRRPGGAGAHARDRGALQFSLTDLRYRYPAESVPAGSSEGDWLRS